MEIGALRAALSASSASFEKDMKAARDAVRKSANDMKTSMDGVSKSFNDALKGAFSLKNIMPQLFAVASVAGIVSFVKSTIDAADKMNDLSKSTGVSVETLSTMGYAAKQSGTDMESLGTGFKKLNKNMADAASGTGEAKEAFKVLGISVKNNDGTLKTSEKVMLELADKFAGMEDGAGKTALAIKILGKSGADLIPYFNEGSAGLARLQQEARDLGVALTTEAAQAADEFNDNLTKLVANINGIAKPAISGFAAWINRLLDTDATKLSDAQYRLAFLRKELERFQSIDPNKLSWWEKLNGSKAQKSLDLEESIKSTKKQIAELEQTIAQLEKAASPKSDTPKIAAPIIDGKANEVKKLSEAIDKQIESLIMQANTFGMTEEAAAFYKFTLQKGVTPAQIEMAREILTTIAAQKAQIKAVEESIEAEEKLAVAGKKVFEESRTPLEQFYAKVMELHELLNKGAIDFETYSRAVAKVMETLSGKGEDTKNEVVDQFEELKSTINGWGKDSAAAFVEFAKGGKTSFSDLIDSIMSDMLRMAVYESFFSKIFGNKGLSSIFSAPKKNAHGNAFSGGRVVPFAKGGVISRPMTFPLGLAGEAGPEAILPLKRIGGDLGVKADLSGAGGGGTVVNNYINAADAKSFLDLCRRNPDAITSVFNRDMRMAGSTRSTIRRNL